MLPRGKKNAPSRPRRTPLRELRDETLKKFAHELGVIVGKDAKTN